MMTGQEAGKSFYFRILFCIEKILNIVREKKKKEKSLNMKKYS